MHGEKHLFGYYRIYSYLLHHFVHGPTDNLDVSCGAGAFSFHVSGYCFHFPQGVGGGSILQYTSLAADHMRKFTVIRQGSRHPRIRIALTKRIKAVRL